MKEDLAIAETKLASKTPCLQRLMRRCHELQLLQQQVKHPKMMRLSKRMRDGKILRVQNRGSHMQDSDMQRNCMSTCKYIRCDR